MLSGHSGVTANCQGHGPQRRLQPPSSAVSPPPNCNCYNCKALVSSHSAERVHVSVIFKTRLQVSSRDSRLVVTDLKSRPTGKVAISPLPPWLTCVCSLFLHQRDKLACAPYRWYESTMP